MAEHKDSLEDGGKESPARRDDDRLTYQILWSVVIAAAILAIFGYWFQGLFVGACVVVAFGRALRLTWLIGCWYMEHTGHKPIN